jgi:hypothetical protein
VPGVLQSITNSSHSNESAAGAEAAPPYAAIVRSDYVRLALSIFKVRQLSGEPVTGAFGAYRIPLEAEWNESFQIC